MMPASKDDDIDTFEDRIVQLATVTLFIHEQEGRREGKEINLPFQLFIPPEAGGLEVEPSLSGYM